MEQEMARRKAIMALTLFIAASVMPAKANKAATTESTSCTGEAVAAAEEEEPSIEGATEFEDERVL